MSKRGVRRARDKGRENSFRLPSSCALHAKPFASWVMTSSLRMGLLIAGRRAAIYNPYVGIPIGT